jgi:pimeloyl-[acyl-carrier protein] methyl ester esterase
MDGTGLLLADFAAMLAPPHAVQVVSYPGDEPLGYAPLEDLAARALPADSPYVLIAESFSGPVALGIARQRPAGLRAVVLVCSFARCPRAGYRMLRGLASLAPRVPFRMLALAGLGLRATGEQRQALRVALGRVASSVLVSRLQGVVDVDVTSAVAQIEVPLLYLRARQDRLVPAQVGRELVRSARDGTLVDLPGPHFLLQAAPEAAARVVHDFVSRLAVPA